MTERPGIVLARLFFCACLLAGVAGCGLGQALPLLLIIPLQEEEEEGPKVSSVQPDTGSTAGGTAVTVRGERFESGATVTFGASPATSVVYVSSTELTCNTPGGTAGAVDVTVANPDEESHTLAGAYTYVVPDTTPPADVTTFTATPGNLEIQLDWANPGDTDFAGVMVRRSTTAYPATIADGTQVYSGTGTSHLDQSLTEGIPYYYTAFAFDNEPNYSTGVNATATIDITPPADVTAFTATEGVGLITLDWTNPGDADFQGVMVRRSTTGFPATTTDGILIYDGAAPPQDDTTVVEGNTYYYTAFAYDGVPNHSSGANASEDYSDDTVTHSGWIGGGFTNWQTGDTCSGGITYQHFNSLRDVFVTSGGDIYVADMSNDRVSKWSNASGSAVGWIGGGTTGWQTGDAIAGATDYESFNNPYSVFVDSSGIVYVGDLTNDRVSRWDDGSIPVSALNYIGDGQDGWHITGSGSGVGLKYFDSPRGVCLDGSGNLYVVDWGNDRVCRWTVSTGIASGWIGGGQNGWQTGDAGAAASDYQSFSGPTAVCLDSAGNIYVADSGNNRICKWDSSGNAIGWIGGGQDGWQIGSGAATGNGYQSFNYPFGLFVTAKGYVYVGDTTNHRVSKWASNGQALGWFGNGSDDLQTGSAPSGGSDERRSFSYAYGLHVTSTGAVYVADGNGRISLWTD